MPGIRPNEDPDLLPRRRKKTTPPSVAPRERQARAAYDFVRLSVDLEGPTAPADQSGFGSPHHPGWAVRRAFVRLVKEGVLRGPVELPKRDERGQPVWYQHRVPVTVRERWRANSVVWAEGAWRRTHFHMPEWRIRSEAAVPKRIARKRNRDAAEKHRFETEQTRSNTVFRGIHPARRRTVELPVPSMSMKAAIRQYFRGLKEVDWDGMAYVPVPGPARDAVLAWRASLPAPKVATSPVVKDVEEKRKTATSPVVKDVEEKRKTCHRCGASFPLWFWRNKRTHALKECNVLLVTRVMTE
jgi:hypothetical protein